MAASLRGVWISTYLIRPGIDGHRQRVIDAQWEKTLAEREHRCEQAEARSFHKAPSDADWNIK